MNSRQSNNDRVNRAMMLSCFLKLSLADVIALSFRMINAVHALFLFIGTIKFFERFLGSFTDYFAYQDLRNHRSWLEVRIDSVLGRIQFSNHPNNT